MKKLIQIFFILLIFIQNGLAQNFSSKYAVGFKADNDSFLAIKQDRYYTNGLFIYLKKSADTLYFDTLKYKKKIWGLEIGHQMYNPRSGNIKSIYSVDRPFAGYLYLSTTLGYFYQNESSIKLNFKIGTIGPDAKGEEIQKFIHKTFGFYDINGWEFQVNNEVGVNFEFDYEKLLFRSKNKKLDLSLPTSIKLGTTFTNASLGTHFRVGKLNQFFHSAYQSSNIGNVDFKNLNYVKEWYFYYKPSVNYIIYDATMQGGLFNSEKGLIVFKPYPVVFSNELGYGFTNQKWSGKLNFIFNSKEVRSIAKPHQYGSITIFKYF